MKWRNKLDRNYGHSRNYTNSNTKLIFKKLSEGSINIPVSEKKKRIFLQLLHGYCLCDYSNLREVGGLGHSLHFYETHV